MGAKDVGFWIDQFYDVGSVLLTSRCAYSKPGLEELFIAQFGPKKNKKQRTAPMEKNIRCCSSKKLIILIYLLVYFLFIQDIMF
jgi:hypothetical protein